MTDLVTGLAAVQHAYREGLRPLLAVPWRTGRSHEGNLWARTGAREDWKDDFPIGSVRTGELAAEVCAAHNERLLLGWFLGAGLEVSVAITDNYGGGPGYGVRLDVEDATGTPAAFSGHETLAGALAAAKQWAENNGYAP